MTTIQLGYWNSRGFAHPIRQLLYFTKLDFENVTWGTSEAWHAKKAEIFGNTTQLANCPFLKDGDYIVTESTAIPFYVAHRANRADLIGKDVKDQARVREIQGAASDLFQSIVKHIWADNIKEIAGKAAQKGGATYKVAERLSRFLGEKEFLLGYFTYADLLLVHYIQFTRNACLSLEAADPYTDFGNLLALVKRVEGLPELEGFPYNNLPYVPPDKLTWFKTHNLPE